LAVDGEGNVLVAGNSYTAETRSDYAIIKYSRLSVPPIPLNFQSDGSQIILRWTNPVFSLQSASAAHGSYTNIPGALSPYTNLINGSQQYFRLKSN
jgi:hypothetical protein